MTTDVFWAFIANITINKIQFLCLVMSIINNADFHTMFWLIEQLLALYLHLSYFAWVSKLRKVTPFQDRHDWPFIQFLNFRIEGECELPTCYQPKKLLSILFYWSETGESTLDQNHLWELKRMQLLPTFHLHFIRRAWSSLFENKRRCFVFEFIRFYPLFLIFAQLKIIYIEVNLSIYQLVNIFLTFVKFSSV